MLNLIASGKLDSGFRKCLESPVHTELKAVTRGPPEAAIVLQDRHSYLAMRDSGHQGADRDRRENDWIGECWTDQVTGGRHQAKSQRAHVAR